MYQLSIEMTLERRFKVVFSKFLIDQLLLSEKKAIKEVGDGCD